ncbi:MAG: hypothetical protein ACYCWW_10390 [Deltaproteobacteria bacterium]
MAVPAPDIVAALPLPLREVLAEIRDEAFRDRLEKVFLAAAGAIGQLRGFDLIRFESETAETGMDLQLLEQVAPVLMETVGQINAVVQAIEESFPQGWRAAGPTPLESQKAGRTIDILRERSQALRSDVLRLGAQLRSPQMAGDRWNLLDSLQGARGKLRAGLGEMIVDAMNVFVDVDRSDVVPEFDVDIEHALLLRRTLAKLMVALRAHHERMAHSEPIDIPPMLDRLGDVLARLTKTQAWFELRAPDKREFIRFRETLAELVIAGAPPSEARAAVEGFLRFIELLTPTVSRREALKSHDRAALAELTAELERAEAQLPGAPSAATAGVATALEVCDRLYGRDEEIDRFVAGLKGAPRSAGECIELLREHALRLLMLV